MLFAKGVKPANWKKNEELVHLHCLIRGTPVHAGSWLQPMKAKGYRVVPSARSRGDQLQAGSPSTA